MDPSALLAIAIAIACVLGGNALEGGKVTALLQPTAAVIVLGGTLGATWLASPARDLKKLVGLLRRVVYPDTADRRMLLEDIVRVSIVARREGMLAVEGMLDQIQDDFLRRALQMLVDGLSAEDVKRVLEPEIELEESHSLHAARVLDTAGGVSPTIGILGAVLGLIHVMQNLNDPAKLGTGIAVAFVATIYGVGFANLLYIPLAARIKRIVATDTEARVMVLTGVLGIASGTNARQIEEQLAAFTPRDPLQEVA